MSHYLFNYLCTTSAVIVLLYVVYLYIKNHPHLGVSSQKPVNCTTPLKVETVLQLEPRKKLYVVSYGHERFLLSTTAENTELLHTLSPGLPLEQAESNETLNIPPESTTLSLTNQFLQVIQHWSQNTPLFGKR